MRMTSRSHQGLVRLNNEDRVYCDVDDAFVVLADGMGGLLAGEVASGVAIDTACQGLRRLDRRHDHADDLADILREAHEAVVGQAKAMGHIGKMGTTLIIWALRNQHAYFAHVGDSRLYTYTAGDLAQITVDHTLAQRFIDEGKYEPDDEENVPNSHVLTQAMGLPGIFAVDTGQVADCERVLLCSDGLSDLVSASQIAEIMAMADLEACADELVGAALDKGGRDNVTVALIEF